MPESFTSITYEVYIAGAWVDISADVRLDPAPRFSGIGIMATSISDRVGDAGKFEFTLDNSTGNSGGVLGYYTPGHPDVRSGWTHGLRVRVTFVYDGYSKVMDDFYIDFDGIEVIPGKYGKREVNVTASNWMKSAADHRLNLLQRKTNYNIFNSVQDIIDNADRKPVAMKWWGHGSGGVTFPTVFDTTESDTQAISEFQKLAVSELGYIYERGDGTVVVESQTNARRGDIGGDSFDLGSIIPTKSTDFTDSLLLETGGTDNLLMETGDDILLEHSQYATFTDADIRDMEVVYGKNLANQVKFVLYPRTLDAAPVVLSTLEEPIEILAGETLTEIRNQYRDPNSPDTEINGFDMVAPVATTDYLMFSNSDGLTGTDRTADLSVTAEYGNSEVRYTLTNNNAATSYIGKLDARGKGIYIYDTVDVLYRETITSIPTYGIKTLNLDCVYLDSLDQLYSYADKGVVDIFGTGILAGLAYNEMSIESVTFDVNKSSKMMMAFMHLDAGRMLSLFETMSEVDYLNYADYQQAWFINGYDIEIIDNKLVRWTCVMKYVGRS